VTNGVYANGGKVMAGDLTNRIALDKAVTVWSVNGAQETIIQGVGDNGLGAVRCAWLTNGAVLNGFTLRGGATRSAGDAATLLSGGGVWCVSTNALVANCNITGNSTIYDGGGSYFGTLNNCTLTSNSSSDGAGSAYGVLNNCTLTGNSASLHGGGSYHGTLNNCTLTGNLASYGGGSSSGTLNNCTLTGNSASLFSPGNSQNGGGSYSGRLNNCTLTGNSASRYGGGSYLGTLTNCIVWGNVANNSANYNSSTLSYTCTSPLAPGTGNIALDPQLIDGAHIAVTSPCRGSGTNSFVSGTDIDGESWANPPSMGCDEVWEAALTGPLSVVVSAPLSSLAEGVVLPLTGYISGRVSRLEWSFGDGPSVTNTGFQTAHVWTNAGDYTVTLTAFNTDHPAGVSTNLLIHVVPLELPVLVESGKSSNSFQFTFGSQAGVNYVVEYATNLTPTVLWQTLQSQTSTGGVIEVRDGNPTNNARFYRVRVP